MDMDKTTTVTITLSEDEARRYWEEVHELTGLLKDVDGGNTRTGLMVVRAIQDELGDRGFGPVPTPPLVPFTYPQPPMPPLGVPVLPAAEWGHIPQPPPYAPPPPFGPAAYPAQPQQYPPLVPFHQHSPTPPPAPPWCPDPAGQEEILAALRTPPRYAGWAVPQQQAYPGPTSGIPDRHTPPDEGL
jgi:hypothetical protein